MTLASLFISAFLMIGAVLALLPALGRRRQGADLSIPRKFSPKWMGVSLLLAGLSVLVFVTVFMPGIVRDRIAEAEAITRKTFRDKQNREPDTVTFDTTDRKTGMDGWRYVGVATFGKEAWTVTVTRSNDNPAHKTTLQCEAEPQP